MLSAQSSEITLEGDEWILSIIFNISLAFIFKHFFKRLIGSFLIILAPERFCPLEISTS